MAYAKNNLRVQSCPVSSVHDIPSARTLGRSLNSAGERRRGTLADRVRVAIVLLDLIAVVSGRAENISAVGSTVCAMNER